MKLVTQLIWRELRGPFLNSVAMFLMVLFAAAYLFILTDLLVRGVAIGSVLLLAVYGLAIMVTQTLPMAMLLASLLAMGRLSGDSEHIALYAGGISFYRVVAPVIWLGLIVSGAAFVWDETVVPVAASRFNTIKQTAAEDVITKGTPLFYTVTAPGSQLVAEWVYAAGGYDAKAHGFRNVNIVKLGTSGAALGKPEFALNAEIARPNRSDPTGLDWTYEGVYLVDMRNGSGANRVLGNYQRLKTRDLQNETSADMGMARDFKGVMEATHPDNHAMTFVELSARIKRERAAGSLDTLGDEVDLWGKISTPLASLVFGLVGAPLGIRPQRTTKAVGFGMAIGIIFIYWVTYNWLYQIGKHGGLTPLLASFMPNIIGIIVGVVLVARTRQ